MTKDNILKLDLQAIEQETKATQSVSRGFVTMNNKNYEVDVRDTFTEIEIQNVLKDLLEFIDEAVKVEENTSIDLLVYTQPYITTLLIKHFTDMKMPDDIYETIAVTKNMINLGVLDQLLALFPQDELSRTMERVAEALQTLDTNMQDLTKENGKLTKGKQKAEAKMRKNAKKETNQKIKDSNKLIEETLKIVNAENEDEKDGAK